MGKDLAPVLRMESTGNAVPIPSVVADTAEYELDEHGREISVSAQSYSYGGTLGQILEGGDYYSGKAASFMNHLNKVFQTSGGNVPKAIQQVPVPGRGGHFTFGSALPRGHVLISNEAMRGAVQSILKTQGLNPTQGLMDKALASIAEQGGMYGLFSKNPSYGRKGMTPVKMVSADIARDKYKVDLAKHDGPLVAVRLRLAMLVCGAALVKWVLSKHLLM